MMPARARASLHSRRGLHAANVRHQTRQSLVTSSIAQS